MTSIMILYAVITDFSRQNKHSEQSRKQQAFRLNTHRQSSLPAECLT